MGDTEILARPGAAGDEFDCGCDDAAGDDAGGQAILRDGCCGVVVSDRTGKVKTAEHTQGILCAETFHIAHKAVVVGCVAGHLVTDRAIGYRGDTDHANRGEAQILPFRFLPASRRGEDVFGVVHKYCRIRVRLGAVCPGSADKQQCQGSTQQQITGATYGWARTAGAHHATVLLSRGSSEIATGSR